ncbi:hypothetical protein HDU83_003301 [Entophlyctis luteolus]|nr:hypothetical protein HDU83_003301 [Entophlyctis luteolus]
MSILKTVSAAQALAIDASLMRSDMGGFALEQLMELAGLAVAECAYKLLHPLPVSSLPGGSRKSVLVICGPGNNGGDGLVAARHLVHFGVPVRVCYPKPVARLTHLVTQLDGLHVPFVPVSALRDSIAQLDTVSGLVVDAIFGFSFAGDVRPPFGEVIETINAECERSRVRVLCVDVPSGWDVDKGNLSGKGIQVQDALISLTAPKPCSLQFKGRHFVGGRFVPPFIQQEYGIDIPPYVGTEQCVELGDKQPLD